MEGSGRWDGMPSRAPLWRGVTAPKRRRDGDIAPYRNGTAAICADGGHRPGLHPEPRQAARQRALLPCRTATPYTWCTRRQGLGRGKGAIDGTPQSKRGRGNRSLISVYQRHSTRICFFVSSTINFQRFWFASFDNFTCFAFGPFPFHARMGYFPGFTPLAATGRINAS